MKSSEQRQIEFPVAECKHPGVNPKAAVGYAMIRSNVSKRKRKEKGCWVKQKSTLVTLFIWATKKRCGNKRAEGRPLPRGRGGMRWNTKRLVRVECIDRSRHRTPRWRDRKTNWNEPSEEPECHERRIKFCQIVKRGSVVTRLTVVHGRSILSSDGYFNVRWCAERYGQRKRIDEFSFFKCFSWRDSNEWGLPAKQADRIWEGAATVTSFGTFRIGLQKATLLNYRQPNASWIAWVKGFPITFLYDSKLERNVENNRKWKLSFGR